MKVARETMDRAGTGLLIEPATDMKDNVVIDFGSGSIPNVPPEIYNERYEVSMHGGRLEFLLQLVENTKHLGTLEIKLFSEDMGCKEASSERLMMLTINNGMIEVHKPRWIPVFDETTVWAKW